MAALRCNNSPPDPKTNCQSLFQVLSYPKPAAVHVYPGWAQCAATETDGGSFRQQRSTVAQVPSNTPETYPCQIQSTPSSHSAKRENRKENRSWRVGRVSAASELRHCLRQSREFPLVGTGQWCLPIQLQWPRICSRAHCIALLRSDGSVKEETSIWLPRNTTLLGCLYQG